MYQHNSDPQGVRIFGRTERLDFKLGSKKGRKASVKKSSDSVMSSRTGEWRK